MYGVDEDEGGHPSVPTPFTLSGQRERIDSIARISVDEVLSYKISIIRTDADSSLGYIVVVVPPSERAPHMVTVKGERRYYGRGETGNYVLSQAEVARLYERREQSAASPINQMIDSSISAPPLPSNPNFAHLHLVVAPVLSDDALLTKALVAEKTIEEMLTNLAIEARDDTRLSDVQYSPDFNPPKAVGSGIRITTGAGCRMVKKESRIQTVIRLRLPSDRMVPDISSVAEPPIRSKGRRSLFRP